VDILLIHQAFCGPQDPGGTRHYELAQRVVAMGHRFTVITSEHSYLTGRKKTAPPDQAEIDLHMAPAIGGWHQSYFNRMLAFMSFMLTSIFTALRVQDPDVVIGTSPPMFQACSAWAVAAIRHRPFVLEVRDLWPAFAIDLGILRSRLLILLARKLENFLYAHARAIIVNSPSYRDYLLQIGIPDSKISVIPNGTDVSLFRPEARGEAVRNDHELTGKFVVMYAGALGLANDIDCVLNAAARLRYQTDIVFALVGDGKDLSQLRMRAESLELNNIRFIAAQPKKRMPEVLAAADVCVATLKDVPMLRTTYPNKVFDYMAAGRPTVLAIEGPIREVIEKSGGGMCVPPGDDAAVAAAVLELYHRPEVRQEMATKARSYVVLNFDRGLQAEKFLHTLERCYSGDTAPVQEETLPSPALSTTTENSLDTI